MDKVVVFAKHNRGAGLSSSCGLSFTYRSFFYHYIGRCLNWRYVILFFFCVLCGWRVLIGGLFLLDLAYLPYLLAAAEVGGSYAEEFGCCGDGA